MAFLGQTNRTVAFRRGWGSFGFGHAHFVVFVSVVVGCRVGGACRRGNGGDLRFACGAEATLDAHHVTQSLVTVLTSFQSILTAWVCEGVRV